MDKEINNISAVENPFPLGKDGKGLVITIVGVGLISGSFALAMKEKGFAKHIIGVSRTEASAKKAVELGIIDEDALAHRHIAYATQSRHLDGIKDRTVAVPVFDNLRLAVESVHLLKADGLVVA